jgi:hypothetical protein
LNDEIRKNSILKKIIIEWSKSTRVNLQNPWPRSWGYDNFIENKLK